MALEKYTTSVVGAHSVPRWYEALEKQVEAGTLSAEDMVDAQFRATQAIADEEGAGIDVVNGGEAPPHQQPPCPAQRDAQPLLKQDPRVLTRPAPRRSHQRTRTSPIPGRS